MPGFSLSDYSVCDWLGAVLLQRFYMSCYGGGFIAFSLWEATSVGGSAGSDGSGMGGLRSHHPQIQILGCASWVRGKFENK